MQAQEQRERIAHRLVVVDDGDERRAARGASVAGNREAERAARVARLVPQPAAVRIDDRAADGEPETHPGGFVVTNGSNSDAAISSAMPGPLSATLMRTKPGASRAASTRTSRSPARRFSASIALASRLCSTASICTRSTSTLGRFLRRLLERDAMPVRTLAHRCACVIDQHRLARSISIFADPERKKSRRRRTTLPARFASTITLSIVAPSSLGARRRIARASAGRRAGTR